ncbi:MAG: four helix bundle protein [Elusimicrobia bacterium]|nr:four helix bundle protein [Elusimicrobiota bacterium]
MKIERFEDIESWKQARILMNMVYELTKNPSLQKDFGLKDQMQRAATSVMANIAEGFDGQSDTSFIQFLIYARRSLAEVQSHLYVSLDQKYMETDQFDGIYSKATEVKSLISGFMRYLRKSKQKK